MSTKPHSTSNQSNMHVLIPLLTFYVFSENFYMSNMHFQTQSYSKTDIYLTNPNDSNGSKLNKPDILSMF